MSAHLTLLQLDALAEAGPSEAQTNPHLAACSGCAGKLSEMVGFRAEFDGEVFAKSAAAVEARVERPRLRLAFLAPLVLVPALAVLLFVSLPRPLPLAVAPGHQTLRTKGHAALKVFLRRGPNVEEVPDGAKLQPGDQLRFEVQPGGDDYLLIGSVDADGQTGIIYPVDGTESAHIDPLGQFVTPGSAVLDEARGPERLFVILSRRPVDSGKVTEALRVLGKQGPEAIRQAGTLDGVEADTELSFHWEKP